MTGKKTPTIPLGAWVTAPSGIIRRYQKISRTDPRTESRVFWERLSDLFKNPSLGIFPKETYRITGLYTGWRNGSNGIIKRVFGDQESTTYKATETVRYAYIVPKANMVPIKVFYDDLKILKLPLPGIEYCPECGQEFFENV